MYTGYSHDNEAIDLYDVIWKIHKVQNVEGILDSAYSQIAPKYHWLNKKLPNEV